jgi:hypothetical protein
MLPQSAGAINAGSRSVYHVATKATAPAPPRTAAGTIRRAAAVAVPSPIGRPFNFHQRCQAADTNGQRCRFNHSSA